MTKIEVREQFVSENARSALIVASSHDAIIGTNSAGLIRSCNPAAAKMYGLAARDIIGQNAEAFVPVEFREMEVGIRRRIVGGAEVAQYRTERLCRDGSVLSVSTSISPIVDSTGMIVGAATVSRKVSALQQAQDRFEIGVDQHRAEARNAAERLEIRIELQRAEAQGAADRFEVQVDLERTAANHAAERYEVQVVEERSAASDAADRYEVQVVEERSAASDAADRFEVQVDLERTAASDAADRYEVRVDEEREHARNAQDESEAQIDAERVEAQLEVDHLQGQLQQSQRLEVLGRLAGGVAHDFNNLLAAILNYAAFVGEELAAGAEGDLAAASRDVTQIQRAAQRATGLTHQLLAFARREVVQPRVIDLNEVVAEVQQLLDRTIGEDVVLQTDLAADLWPVLADTGQIEQILVNLAVNARDAMTGGGVLSIDTANIDVGAELSGDGLPVRSGRYVRLRVGDTGTGMSPDVMAHVFEPFYTTKSAGSGTGLGLATVYGIVVQADATIDIHSRLGVGTTFTIMVPITEEAAVPFEEPAICPPAATGETILVVEDEEALREVTDRIFTRCGYHVLTAADGVAALALAASHDGTIDLLVTDVVMPKMLGKEVAEKMVALRPGISVLYMSGYAQPVLASQGRLDPDVNLIEKPFSAAKLVEKAGQILSNRPGDR